MAMSVRTFLKSVAGLAIAFAGGGAYAQGTPPTTPLTMSAFIAWVRTNAELRARFADNPRVVLRENGIDPTPYNLPDKISPQQMDSLLDDLSRSTRQASPAPDSGGTSSPSPAVAVYGPPAGMRRP